jgi:peroxiredoxin
VPVFDLDRSAKSVDGLRAGRVALLTFWATWCEACQKEQEALNRLHERATGDKAVVIGVAVGEPSLKVKSFVEQHGLRYAQLVDEEFRLTDALGQRRLPATVIVNRDGKVVYRGGALDAEALAAFRDALKE